MRSYHVTPEVLSELGQAGVAADVLAALKPLLGHRFASRRALLQALHETHPQPLDRETQGAVVKLARRSLLRLERLIPNRVYREWAEAFIFAVVMAMLLRAFVVAPFKIPSGSMLPTIQIGDHIFATMYSYGLHIPFTDIRVLAQPVERGDIVIFPYPLDPSRDYIKRVVGLGGETLELRGTQLYIDGKPLDEPYAFYDPEILAQLKRMGREAPSFGPVKIPAGSLFMMGDNRFNSADSRVWGYLHESEVRGRGQIIYWSHDPHAGLLGGYNLGRIGTILR